MRAFIPGPARAVLAALCAATVLCAAIVAAAPAAATVTKRATRTFTLPAATTRTFVVAFPDALKFGDSTYSGSVTVRAAARAGLAPPALARVRLLRRGPALGGSDYEARIANANPAGTAPVRVVIVAVTREPASP